MADQKQIFTIGYTIPAFDKNYIDFYDDASLMDADILLICPDSFTPRGGWVSFSSSDSGCYDVEASRLYKQKISRLKKEIGDHLDTGKNVFIFLAKREEYSLAYSVSTEKKGQRLYSTETNNNYDFLPINIGTLTSASGKHIEFSGNIIFSDFYKNFKQNLEYQLYIQNLSGAQVVFTGKDKTKVLGAIYKVKKGHIVVLPSLSYDKKEFTERKEGKSYWTDEAVKFGKILAKTLKDIDQTLSESGDKTPPPGWISQVDFQLQEEKVLTEEVESTLRAIDGLIVKKNDLLAKIEQETKLKDLLFETGKTLENAINLGLEILGYKAENYNDGILELDHVIVSPEGDRFIGEAEGKDTSAVNIDKLRQLLINIHEDVQREEVEIPAVGILFGNGFRLTEPSERTEQFTVKCLSTAKSSNCILVKTSDLFQVAKYIKESGDQNFAKSCRDAIKLSIGKIVDFPHLPSARDASK